MSEAKTAGGNSEEEYSSSLSDSESDSLTPSDEDDSLTENSEESDEFELDANATLSNVKTSLGQKKSEQVVGQHYDEAMELSASEQSIMSEAGAGGAQTQNKITGGGQKPTTQVNGEHYDEAMDLSVSESMMSTDDTSSAIVVQNKSSVPPSNEAKDSEAIKNNRYDEAISLDSEAETSFSSSGDADAPTPARSAPAPARKDEDDARGDSPPSSPPPNNDRNGYKDLVDQKQKDITEDSANLAEQQNNFSNSSDGSSSDSESSDSASSDSEDAVPRKQVTPLRGTPVSTTDVGDGASQAPYDNKDYSHLNVSSDIQTMFKYIGNFKPIQVEIESKIKCFIPDFMPAIGSLDNFVKVPRPDSKPDQLGLAVVDEPAATQSDATVLELQFLSTAKTQRHKRINVRSIERAEKNPAEITRWITSMADLHRDKPLPTVTYQKPMPDVETLMQVWPEEFEAELKKLKLPPGEIDLTTKEYAMISCGLVDIPVYQSVVQSLHVLFTLYSEFRSNQHFTNHLTENADEAVELSDSDNQETPPSSPETRF